LFAGKELPRNCSIKLSWDGRKYMKRSSIIFTISIVSVDGALNLCKFTIPIWLIKGKETQQNIDENIQKLK
jgi:hypothetical protein